MQAKSSEILSPNAQSALKSSHPSDLYSLQQKPLASLRSVFGQWIRSMAMQERFVAVKVHLPEAVPLVKLIFSKAELPVQSAGNEQRGGHVLDSKKFARKYEKNFYESVIFVSDGHCFLDHICFDYSLMECPEKLFDLFMSPSQTATNRTLAELIKISIDPSSLNQRLYKLTAKEQLSYQLFLFLRQQVLINFLQSQQNNEIVARKLEEEKKRKKEFNNSWKVMSQDTKQRFLLLGHPHVEALREWLNDKGFPVKTSELEKEIQDLLKLERNDFCNRIFKCKLRKVLSPLLGYYEHIYHQWKNEIQKFRKKRNNKSNRNERDYSSQQKKVQNKESSMQHNRKYKKSRKANSVESNQTNQTEDSKAACLEKRQSDCRYNEPVNKMKDFESKAQDQLQFEGEKWIHQAKQPRGQTKIEFNPQKQLHQLLETPKKPISISSTSTKLSSKNSQSQIESEKPQKNTDFLKQISINKLNQQLQQIADRISQEANQFHDRRVIAFQRIQFLLQYYNVPIKLFGSCASGIAIRNSDIDIAIDNSILNYMDFLPEPERIKVALERLEELFKTQAWITQIKFIKTAAIPLIKLTIDTSLSFLDYSIGQMYYQLNRPHNCGPINADITVETKNKSEQCSHLGLISTNAINKWLSEISSLHSIIIILKEFFAKRKLNCTYEGGLNTFSMIVLLVAYIFHAKLEEEENAALVFEKILRFYVEEFNEKERGIDILNKESNNIFYIKNLVNVEGGNCKNSKQKADLEIKDPMNQQKNMTRNCYSFHAIKNLFKDMLESCFSRGYKELQEIASINESKLEPKTSISEINREVFSKRNVFIQFLDAAC